MFLMRADPLRGQVGGGCAPELRVFGPCEMAFIAAFTSEKQRMTIKRSLFRNWKLIPNFFITHLPILLRSIIPKVPVPVPVHENFFLVLHNPELRRTTRRRIILVILSRRRRRKGAARCGGGKVIGRRRKGAARCGGGKVSGRRRRRKGAAYCGDGKVSRRRWRRRKGAARWGGGKVSGRRRRRLWGVGTEGQVDEGAGQGGGERSQQDGVGTVVEATGEKGCQQLSLMLSNWYGAKN